MAKSLIRIETPDLEQPLSAKLLGEAVRARRTQSGLRLEEAALLCKVAKQTLMKIEHGSDKVTLFNVLKVLSGFGISLKITAWKS